MGVLSRPAGLIESCGKSFVGEDWLDLWLAEVDESDLASLPLRGGIWGRGVSSLPSASLVVSVLRFLGVLGGAISSL